MIKFKIFILFFYFFNLFGATDGAFTKGTSSSSVGTSEVFVMLVDEQNVQINGLNDIDLGVYDSNTMSLFGGDTFCIYTNTGVTNISFYDIIWSDETFITHNSGSQFGLIPYRIDFGSVSDTGVVQYEDIDTQAYDYVYISESRSNPNCDISGTTRDNVALRVIVNQTHFQNSLNVTGGSYTGFLALEARPE